MGTRHQQRQGVGKDSYLTVEAVNRPGNSLTLRTGDGRCIEASPAKWAKAAEVYTQKRLLFRLSATASIKTGSTTVTSNLLQVAFCILRRPRGNGTGEVKGRESNQQGPNPAGRWPLLTEGAVVWAPFGGTADARRRLTGWARIAETAPSCISTSAAKGGALPASWFWRKPELKDGDKPKAERLAHELSRRMLRALMFPRSAGARARFGSKC
jgi:hypothetical protein